MLVSKALPVPHHAASGSLGPLSPRHHMECWSLGMVEEHGSMLASCGLPTGLRIHSCHQCCEQADDCAPVDKHGHLRNGKRRQLRLVQK